MNNQFDSEAFLQMHEAVIDACSIIYLIKTGVLWTLGAVFSLHSTEDVVTETEWKDLPVQVLQYAEDSVSHDEALVKLAAEHGWPVISDDKEVLMMAKAEGLSYYNSFMMLLWLESKGRISSDESSEYYVRLKKTARYSDSVWNRGLSYRNLLGL